MPFCCFADTSLTDESQSSVVFDARFVTKILKRVSGLSSNFMLFEMGRTTIMRLRTETGRRSGVSRCV